MPRQIYTTAELARTDRSNVFDAEYYQVGCGPSPYQRNDKWLAFFRGIAAEIVRSLRPEKVFDMGCAMGMLVESLWDLGVPAAGVDISSYAIGQVRLDMRRYCHTGSVTDPIEGRYGLISCIEVLEHVLAEEAQQAIAVMAAATDTILFSSTPNDFAEETHINVQPVLAWIEQFAAVRFVPDLKFDASFLAPHAILFRRAAERLNPDVAALFSNFIYLRTALVEREQRIGRLNMELEQLRTDALNHAADVAGYAARYDEIARLFIEQEATFRNQLVAVVEKGNGELLSHIKAQLCSESGHTSDQLAAGAAKSDEIARRLTELELTSRRQFEGAIDRGNEELLSRIKDLHQQMASGVAEASAERDNLTQRLREAVARIEQLDRRIAAGELDAARTKEELRTVYSSPGWQLISRYRNWLARGRVAGSTRRIEPLLNWTVRAIGLNPAREKIVSPELAGPALLAAPSPAINTRAASITQPPPPEFTYEAWAARTEPNIQELELQRLIARQFRLQPLISIVVPVYRVPVAVLSELLDSVRQQTYGTWELCLIHADTEDTAAREVLTNAAARDPRIRVKCAVENLGISGNTNLAIEMVHGEYLALLDHDDTLAPFALYEVVKVINEQPEADFIYSDKDCISEDGRVRLRPLFKPRWSPDIMLSVNYLTHFNVMRTDVVRAVGGWRSKTDGAQDWDVFLRCIRRSRRVEFIPKVLYHWRIISTSVASTGLQAKPYAAQGQERTIDDHLKDLGVQGKAVFNPSQVLKVEWSGLQDLGASIIIVSDAPAAKIRQRARELAKQTGHPAFEVVAIAPQLTSGLEGPIHWIACPESMLLPARLNEAARQCSFPCLVFLDDSVSVAGDDWLSELVGPLQLKAVALVGPKLLDPRTWLIRHAGIVFNRDGKPDYIFSGEPEHVNGPFGGGYWYRNWSAISGACFAVRRTVWEQLQGFRETPEYPRFDIDLCLRAQIEFGYRILYNPFASFRQEEDGHLEKWLSPGGPDAGAAFIRSCLPAGDPYFHSQLECRAGSVRFARPEWSTPTSSDYAADARALTAGFDFSNADVERSAAACSAPARHEMKTVTWFLPEFSHGFYGGIHTILRFAEYFSRAHGVWSNFIYLGGTPESVMRSRIAGVFPALGEKCGVSRLQSYEQLDSFPATDAAIATLWTTAFAMLRFPKVRRKFYFMQDYESLFYPAGSIYGLVEGTYRFGFEGICNTRGLLDTYTSLGGSAEYFDPCIDPSIFYPPEESKRGKPAMVFCYARPGHPRNCFELLAAALTKVKRELGAGVRIVAAGAEWDPATYDLDGVLVNLGLIGYNATGALYRACDAGVVMMMTRHPSYLPMELMACGALVVTNHSPHTKWLLRHGENCLLTESSASAVADTLLKGLSDHELRSRIGVGARETVRQYSNWDEQVEKIYRHMKSVV